MWLHSLFLFYLTLWRPLGYSLVALGVAFEGDGMLFTSAFLTAEGFFDVGDMMIIIFLSVILGDTIWFLIGRNYIRRFPRLVRLVNKFAKPFDRHLSENPTRTLIFTKFLYGANHAMLLRAGMSEISYKKFIKADLVSIPIWITVVGGLGFFSAHTLHSARHYLKFAEISLALALIGFFVLEYFLHKISVSAELEAEKNDSHS